MTSPMNGALYAHKAMRKELELLEAMAGPGAPIGEERVAALADRIAFFHPVVKGHNDGEEAVLWPALDGRFPHISTPYTLDHRADEDTFQRIEALLAELRVAGGDERAAATEQLRRAIVALSVSVSHHSRKEDSHLAPLVQQSFSAEEQAALVGGMIGYLPRELMPQMLPWMLQALSADERVDYLAIMKEMMPPERFLMAVGWARDGLPPEEWEEMVGQMPELDTGLA
jgi:hemerythrin-like domain-containing protein